MQPAMHAHDRPQPLLPAMLLQAARRLLRPLVRLMMQSGLTFPVLADQLRRLFVEIAVNDILTDPKSRTDSRISLLTGVHRKEIRRLREMPADPADAPGIVTLASQIVARWIGSPSFTDAGGHPGPLPRIGNGLDPRDGTSSAEPSFVALVASVTTDIRPRAVLDALLAHNVVRVDEQDRVRLNADAFIPRPGGQEQLFYFARNLHDHVAASVANVGTAGTPSFLDRSVHYDRLTPARAAALRDYARDAAMRALLDVNRRALALVEQDATEHHGSVTCRVNFGVYVFDEHEPFGPGGDV